MVAHIVVPFLAPVGTAFFVLPVLLLVFLVPGLVALFGDVL